MRAGGGHDKGSDFERYVCRRLSLWLTRGESDSCLWRSATSGGRATFMLRQGLLASSQAGDISAISREGYELIERFLVECKSYKDLQIEQGLLKGIGWLWEFWERTQRDAARHGKLPLLIAKQNRTPVIAAVPTGTVLFPAPELIFHAPRWGADFYLFDPATEYSRPVRRVELRRG